MPEMQPGFSGISSEGRVTRAASLWPCLTPRKCPTSLGCVFWAVCGCSKDRPCLAPGPGVAFYGSQVLLFQECANTAKYSRDQERGLWWLHTGYLLVPCYKYRVLERGTAHLCTTSFNRVTDTGSPRRSAREMTLTLGIILPWKLQVGQQERQSREAPRSTEGRAAPSWAELRAMGKRCPCLFSSQNHRVI